MVKNACNSTLVLLVIVQNAQSIIVSTVQIYTMCFGK